MMKMRKQVLLLLLFGATTCPLVTDAGATPQIYGAGQGTCRFWTVAREYPNGVEPESLGWIEGYVSAMTVLSPDSFRKTDAQRIGISMDKICAGHPSKQISDATLELIRDLRME